MLAGYYKIWVDAILVTRSSKTESQNWKAFTIIPISALQGINLATFLLLIRAFSSRNFKVVLPVSLFNLQPANTFISILLTFFTPFVILNYLLILNNDRYNDLIKIYRPSCKNWYMWYAIITVSIIAVPYLFKVLF